jgi:hypothetical protein
VARPRSLKCGSGGSGFCKERRAKVNASDIESPPSERNGMATVAARTIQHFASGFR